MEADLFLKYDFTDRGGDSVYAVYAKSKDTDALYLGRVRMGFDHTGAPEIVDWEPEINDG